MRKSGEGLIRDDGLAEAQTSVVGGDEGVGVGYEAVVTEGFEG